MTGKNKILHLKTIIIAQDVHNADKKTYTFISQVKIFLPKLITHTLLPHKSHMVNHVEGGGIGVFKTLVNVITGGPTQSVCVTNKGIKTTLC